MTRQLQENLEEARAEEVGPHRGAFFPVDRQQTTDSVINNQIISRNQPPSHQPLARTRTLVTMYSNARTRNLSSF